MWRQQGIQTLLVLCSIKPAKCSIQLPGHLSVRRTGILQRVEGSACRLCI